jgi:hypothetical protein
MKTFYQDRKHSCSYSRTMVIPILALELQSVAMALDSHWTFWWKCICVDIRFCSFLGCSCRLLLLPIYMSLTAWSCPILQYHLLHRTLNPAVMSHILCKVCQYQSIVVRSCFFFKLSVGVLKKKLVFFGLPRLGRTILATFETNACFQLLCRTSVNPVHNAQVCYFNNVWLMFLVF